MVAELAELQPIFWKDSQISVIFSIIKYYMHSVRALLYAQKDAIMVWNAKVLSNRQIAAIDLQPRLSINSWTLSIEVNNRIISVNGTLQPVFPI